MVHMSPDIKVKDKVVVVVVGVLYCKSGTTQEKTLVISALYLKRTSYN